MKTLDEITIEHGTDKATVHPIGAHGYTPHYTKFFEPLRNLPVKFMEIGVGGGESIRTWLEYFPQGGIFGVDINPNSVEVEDERNTFIVGDQGSEEFWNSVITAHGGDWDIIIDDGSHYARHVIESFRCLWPHVRPGGYYVIEDLGVAYGGHPFTEAKVQNHMDFIKDKLDDINRGSEIGFLYFAKELAIIQKRM